MGASVDQQLGCLAAMSSARLGDLWAKLTNSPRPRMSPALLRLALAWEIQARATAGLSRSTQQRLDQLAAAKTRTSPARPGMRLVRSWNGVAHVVTVGEDGIITWSGKSWNSLSEVARAITGTRWSGPAFFGLKRKTAAA
ncbi:DUF2924 domain-containing protein [Sphingomonas aerophila]|uniref:DUF2924 domain-containing protein n=1 Tax=Sphingomonas aerophila TaxID=1344948 RepID=A0A7W9BGP5_9SPHN|nr:DUF2924 domain-containing protein [Sphingomonas aerophila]MBB5716904.1 hypothetical protein [Sphingomonas aerophila]